MSSCPGLLFVCLFEEGLRLGRSFSSLVWSVLSPLFNRIRRCCFSSIATSQCQNNRYLCFPSLVEGSVIRNDVLLSVVVPTMTTTKAKSALEMLLVHHPHHTSLTASKSHRAHLIIVPVIPLPNNRVKTLSSRAMLTTTTLTHHCHHLQILMSSYKRKEK